VHLAAVREHCGRACEEAAEQMEVGLPELLTELGHVCVREVVHHAVKLLPCGRRCVVGAVDEVVELHRGRVHAEPEHDAPGAQPGQPRADLGRVLLEQLGLGVESARGDLAGRELVGECLGEAEVTLAHEQDAVPLLVRGEQPVVGGIAAGRRHRVDDIPRTTPSRRGHRVDAPAKTART
jgi:hypothetical protein